MTGYQLKSEFLKKYVFFFQIKKENFEVNTVGIMSDN